MTARPPRQPTPPPQPAAGHFADARRYTRRNALVPFRLELVAHLLGAPAGERIVDLGCGDGTLSLQFAGAVDEIALVDISGAMLAAARANVDGSAASVTFHQVDLTTDDLDLPAADTVICFGLLAHVGAPHEVFARAAALVRPGGRLLVQVTDAGRPFGAAVWRFDDLFRGIRHYRLARVRAADVEAWASAAGLELVSSVTHAPVVTGFRILPERAQRWVLDRLQEWSWAAPLRVETLLLFSRPADE